MTAATFWAAGGCGDGPPSVESSTTEATVKGVVKVDGQPATEGQIIFDPSNYRRKDAAPRSAPIGRDGSYAVKTLTGENVVTLGGAITKKAPHAAYKREAIDVKPGENTLDFFVSGGGGRPSKARAPPSEEPPGPTRGPGGRPAGPAQ
jgi:hypothetical protein